MGLFGTFGMRALVGKDLTPELVCKIGAAFGTFLGEDKTVIIGRDARLSGEMLESAVISGLVSVGCSAVSIGVVPTPCVQFAVKNLGADGGVVITASHNPPEYNGIKLLDNYGIGISKEEAEPIEEILVENKFYRAPWDKIGKITNINFLDTYNKTIIKLINKDLIEKAKLKVIVDPGNGTTCFTTPYLLQKLGCEVVTINSQLDGTFPGRDSEPTSENLKNLSKAIRATGSDIGIAHDGDGDRCVIVDEDGNVLSGDRTLAILTHYFLEKNPSKTVVTTVATSQVIDDIAKNFGSKVIKTKVGDVYVSKVLKEINGYIGGEENGGVIYPDFVFGRDGSFAACKIIEIMAQEKIPLSKLNEKFPKYYQIKEKMVCPPELKLKVVEKVKKELESLGKLDLTDGVKLVINKSWLLIRFSGTEPLVRVFCESPTENEANELIKLGIQTVKNALKVTNS